VPNARLSLNQNQADAILSGVGISLDPGRRWETCRFWPAHLAIIVPSDFADRGRAGKHFVNVGQQKSQLLLSGRAEPLQPRKRN
jgi:hypothetical protein